MPNTSILLQDKFGNSKSQLLRTSSLPEVHTPYYTSQGTQVASDAGHIPLETDGGFAYDIEHLDPSFNDETMMLMDRAKVQT